MRLFHSNRCWFQRSEECSECSIHENRQVERNVNHNSRICSNNNNIHDNTFSSNIPSNSYNFQNNFSSSFSFDSDNENSHQHLQHSNDNNTSEIDKDIIMLSSHKSTSNEKKNLIGLTLQELIDTLSESIPTITPQKATRIFTHIYTQGQTNFHDMKVMITKREMDELADKFEIRYPMNICAETISPLDKTRKYLFDLHEDERKVEGVVMHFPERERITMCVSSQVGCSMNCSFCHTGSQKLERNLTAAEIVGQVMHAKQLYHNFPIHAYSLPIQTEKYREKRRKIVDNNSMNDIQLPIPDQMERITHIVFMGQGEPL